MAKNEIALKPSYWASVSGGKDSLYMLKLILDHPEKYLLNGVVHFELEIDYPFIKNVIDYMQSECEKRGIKFVRIKPSVSYWDLYEKYKFPSRRARWCNSKYKLNAKKRLVDFMRRLGYNTFFYIGYCVDEKRKYNEIYPLVENEIEESTIIEWAKELSIYNDFYKHNRRCGCMFCPMQSFKELAYLLKFYPKEYEKYISMMKETEEFLTKKKGHKVAIRSTETKYDAEYVDHIVRTKYLPKLKGE